MPNFNAWLSTYPNLPGMNTAALVGRWISEKPTIVTTVSRVSSDPIPAPQTVRLEPASGSVETPQERRGTNVNVAEHYIVIHGYRNHDTETDTDIQRGDRLKANDVLYDVVNVIETFSDRLLASARVSE